MKSFVLAVFGVFFFTALIWTMMFLYGQTIQRPAREHPFLKNQFEVIAHRGGAFEAPENTLAAFTNAASISPEVIFEMDVHLTKDGQIVVLHDDTVDRTTNGKGFIKDLTLAEARALDAAYNFVPEGKTNEYPLRGKNVQIPLLSEVFEKFPNQRMFVEIKPSNSELAKGLYELIKKFNRVDKTVITSEHGMMIKYSRTFDNTILTAAPRDEVLRSVMLASVGLETLDNMPSDMYCIPEKADGITVFTQGLLKEANKRNKKVFLWTIDDDKDMLRLIKENVNGIITDRPKALENLITHLK